jgi:uncharacterized protein
MDQSAGAAMRSQLSQRGFALLEQAERDRLADVLQPLPWIDGMMTALVIAMDASGNVRGILDCLDLVWNEEREAEVDQLTPHEFSEITARVMDHYGHVVTSIVDDDAYRPYLAGNSDPLDAAAHWAAGFCGGIALKPELWAPLFADQEAQSLLVAIFSLVREEDLPEDARADPAFRNVPPEQRERMRRSTVETLPEIVLDLREHALGLDEDDAFYLDEDDDLDGKDEDVEGRREPYVRAAPKVGRNDPCPCGSGKKYKKCCLE